MKNIFDKIKANSVGLYIHTYIQGKYQKLEVQFTRTSNFYDRKWGGDWYLVSSHSGGCL